MCMLCVEIAKGKMTPTEIARAYIEADLDDHYTEVLAVISDHSDRDAVAREIVGIFGQARD